MMTILACILFFFWTAFMIGVGYRIGLKEREKRQQIIWSGAQLTKEQAIKILKNFAIGMIAVGAQQRDKENTAESEKNMNAAKALLMGAEALEGNES